MKGFRSRELESRAGTSTCQPDRSLPLNRFCACSGDDAWLDIVLHAAVLHKTNNKDDFIGTPVGMNSTHDGPFLLRKSPPETFAARELAAIRETCTLSGCELSSLVAPVTSAPSSSH